MADGHHGKHEWIQDLKCQACGLKFTVRRHTVLYRLKTQSARVAEALAKTAVIAGSERAFALLDRPGVHGAFLLTERGELRATPEMLRWLA